MLKYEIIVSLHTTYITAPSGVATAHLPEINENNTLEIQLIC